MAVSPEKQGRGIGKNMVLFAMEMLWGKEFKFIWCTARTSVSAFYEGLGFTGFSEEFQDSNLGIKFQNMIVNLTERFGTKLASVHRVSYG